MKFIIDGNLLETENILRITELEEPSTSHFYDGEMAEGLYQDSRNWQWHFSIIFINNQKSLKLSHYNKDKIENAYNQLVKLWAANQIDIPTIKL